MFQERKSLEVTKRKKNSKFRFISIDIYICICISIPLKISLSYFVDIILYIRNFYRDRHTFIISVSQLIEIIYET